MIIDITSRYNGNCIHCMSKCTENEWEENDSYGINK